MVHKIVNKLHSQVLDDSELHMVAADMWMSSQKSMTEADLEEEECIILGEFMELEMREVPVLWVANAYSLKGHNEEQNLIYCM